MKDNKTQSRVLSILGSLEFDSIEDVFCTKFKWDKILEKVENLTEWQKQRLQNMHSEIQELKEILIRNGVI